MAQLFQIECRKIIPLLKYHSIFDMVDEHPHYVRPAEVHYDCNIDSVKDTICPEKAMKISHFNRTK